MYQGPVIDCDVHHARATDEELLEYLSAGWREYVSDRGPAGIMPLTVRIRTGSCERTLIRRPAVRPDRIM